MIVTRPLVHDVVLLPLPPRGDVLLHVYIWIMPKKVDRKSKRIIGQIGRQAIIMRMRTERVIEAVNILKNSKL